MILLLRVECYNESQKRVINFRTCLVLIEDIIPLTSWPSVGWVPDICLVPNSSFRLLSDKRCKGEKPQTLPISGPFYSILVIV